MNQAWPPGRTEEELLERVYRRARVLRARRRAGVAGALSVVAAAALVPVLVLHPGQSSQSVNTAGQTANPSSRTTAPPSGHRPAPTTGAGGSGPAATAGGSAPGRGAPGGQGTATGSTPGSAAPTSAAPVGVSAPVGPTGSVPAGPVPTVTSLSPASGPATGGTLVTITGSNLSSVVKVLFGTVPAARFTILSSTRIQAVTPRQASAGVVPVGVYDGQGRGSSDVGCYTNPLCTDGFLYLPAASVGTTPLVPSAAAERIIRHR